MKTSPGPRLGVSHAPLRVPGPSPLPLSPSLASKVPEGAAPENVPLGESSAEKAGRCAGGRGAEAAHGSGSPGLGSLTALLICFKKRKEEDRWEREGGGERVREREREKGNTARQQNQNSTPRPTHRHLDADHALKRAAGTDTPFFPL